MDKGEPSLVPEWLKNGGNVTGGGTTVNQFVLSSLHPDDHSISKLSRNKSHTNTSDHSSGRVLVSDRTTSTYFRRSSSGNGSSQSRSYSNFGRNHRDREWDKDLFDSRDRERSILGDYRHLDISDSLGTLPGRFDKDVLRRSQSLSLGKRGETWPRKVATDVNENSYSGNGRHSRDNPTSIVRKAAFDRDFPSLGAEERQMASEIGRVPSPVLGTSIQSLPIGTTAMVGGDKWTSALAEVPMIVGSNGKHSSYIQPAASATSASATSGTTTGLNMAEALAQGPSRAQTVPQLSVETQRLEELAIKQSRQLIPMTPSMPKALVLNNSEKTKPKIGQQVPSSHLVNHSPRGVKSDSSKSSSGGKLHVLKPSREKSGVAPVAKDSSSPSGNKVLTSPLADTPSALGASSTRRNTSALVSAEHKLALANLEKRPTSQLQSRNDFFNLMRKKSMTNSSAVSDSAHAPVQSSSVLEKSGEIEAAADDYQGRDVHYSDSSCGDQLSEKEDGFNNTCDDTIGPCKSPNNGKNHTNSDAILYSEEEEAAFLRSLGWEESNGDDEGLTEEEINGFLREAGEYINSSGLSSKILQGVQPRLMTLNGQMGSFGGGVSSGLSSSDSNMES